MTEDKPKNIYVREIRDKQGNIIKVDVYDIIHAYGVTNSAAQHGLKKLLVTGDRNGNKSRKQDYLDVIASTMRALELEGYTYDKDLDDPSDLIGRKDAEIQILTQQLSALRREYDAHIRLYSELEEEFDQSRGIWAVRYNKLCETKDENEALKVKLDAANLRIEEQKLRLTQRITESNMTDKAKEFKDKISDLIWYKRYKDNVADAMVDVLILGYLYYIKDLSLVEDAYFDSMMLDIKEGIDDIDHRYKHLFTEDVLATMSLFSIQEHQYPSTIAYRANSLLIEE